MPLAGLFFCRRDSAYMANIRARYCANTDLLLFHVCRWLDEADVKTLVLAKGIPWENGYVESFNDRFRDELLNRELFFSVTEAQWVIDQWRKDYNEQRPHSALDNRTPKEFANLFFQASLKE